MRASVPMLLGLFLLSSSVSAVAEPAPPAADPASGGSATLPVSRQFDFKSAINGRSYRVQVAIPLPPAPQNGYAVLYMLRRQYDLTPSRIDPKEAAQAGLSTDPAALGGADESQTWTSGQREAE